MATREQSKAYYERYHASPRAKRERAARNRARREAEKDGKVHKGDGKEVDHIKALSVGGSTGESNTRVISRKKNRSYPRDRNNRPTGRA
jgi:hypothetical protein